MDDSTRPTLALTLATLTVLALEAVTHAAPPADAKLIGGDMTAVAIDGPSWTIYYGAGTNWKTITGSGFSPAQCMPPNFGGDPSPNVAKKCFYTGGTLTTAPCAADMGTCTYAGPGVVTYGVFGKSLTRTVTAAGSLECSPKTFGSDPAPNVPKNCFFRPACEIFSPTSGDVQWTLPSGGQIALLAQCRDPGQKIAAPANYNFTFDFAPSQTLTYSDAHLTCYLNANHTVDLCKYGTPAATIVHPPSMAFTEAKHTLTLGAAGFAPVTYAFFAGPMQRTCTATVPDWTISSGVTPAISIACADSLGGPPAASTSFAVTFDFAAEYPQTFKSNAAGVIAIPAGTIQRGVLEINGRGLGQITAGTHTATISAPNWTGKLTFTVR